MNYIFLVCLLRLSYSCAFECHRVEDAWTLTGSVGIYTWCLCWSSIFWNDSWRYTSLLVKFCKMENTRQVIWIVCKLHGFSLVLQLYRLMDYLEFHSIFRKLIYKCILLLKAWARISTTNLLWKLWGFEGL